MARKSAVTPLNREKSSDADQCGSREISPRSAEETVRVRVGSSGLGVTVTPKSQPAAALIARGRRPRSSRLSRTPGCRERTERIWSRSSTPANEASPSSIACSSVASVVRTTREEPLSSSPATVRRTPPGTWALAAPTMICPARRPRTWSVGVLKVTVSSVAADIPATESGDRTTVLSSTRTPGSTASAAFACGPVPTALRAATETA
ncbi:hypothetical protein GCM10009759_13410 [Kitasatospora saccharophila]|uniref:Uncharacterized protein n=1 Tax=Kitasatospora saccharophila TaxID=407973 RepID=A0ABN2WE87_9ACTN